MSQIIIVNIAIILNEHTAQLCLSTLNLIMARFPAHLRTNDTNGIISSE